MVTRSDLERFVIEVYEKEYSEDSATWRDLEHKAQGTIAIASIFLGAVFALSRTEGALRIEGARVLMIVSMSLLVAVVGLSLAVLWLSSVLVPPGGDRVGKELDKLEDALSQELSPEELDEQARSYFFDLREEHARAVKSIRGKNDRKATLLLVGQSMLVLAVLVTTVLLIQIVLNDPAA